MIRPINRSTVLLSLKSQPATQLDEQVGRDLLDTLAAHRDECVGMAANMIGVPKRIIVVATDGGGDMLMYNPVIVKKSGEYRAQEGCLSLDGVREATRYKRIEVEYLDEAFSAQKRSFTGLTAQIVQHEVDHCDGVLI